jgi:hypothetical protein
MKNGERNITILKTKSASRRVASDQIVDIKPGCRKYTDILSLMPTICLK